MVEIPRIAARTIEPGFSRKRETKLWCVSLAEDDQTRIQIALDNRGIMISDSIDKELRSVRSGRSLERSKILDKEGNAPERSVGQPASDLLSRSVIVLQNNRVDCADLLRSLYCFVEKFLRLYLTILNQLRQSQRIIAAVLAKSCHEHLPVGKQKLCRSVENPCPCR